MQVPAGFPLQLQCFHPGFVIKEMSHSMNDLVPYDGKELSNGMENRYASCGHDILSLSMKKCIHTQPASPSKL